MPCQDLDGLDDLSDTRLDQLDTYADSFGNGTVSEKMLAKRLKALVKEVKRVRQQLSKAKP